VVDREPSGESASCALAHQHRWDRTHLVDEFIKPRQGGVGIEWTVRCLRRSETRQIGGDDMVGRDQVRDHPHPHGRELARQQDNRWAVAAFQHGRGHPGQLQPSLGDRQTGQQPRPGIFTGGTLSRGLSSVQRCHARTVRAAEEAPHRANYPNVAASRTGWFHPASVV